MHSNWYGLSFFKNYLSILPSNKCYTVTCQSCRQINVTRLVIHNIASPEIIHQFAWYSIKETEAYTILNEMLRIYAL